VLLYDQNGVPIDVGGPSAGDPHRRLLSTLHGSQLFNSFPIRYYEPERRGSPIPARVHASAHRGLRRRRSRPRAGSSRKKVAAVSILRRVVRRAGRDGQNNRHREPQPCVS
jgi:hypothetical protein